MEQAFFELTSTPEGRRRYGDPNKGATIQQMWNTQILLGKVANYCLLARPLPAESTQDITRLIKCSAADVVQSLRKLQAVAGDMAVPLAYHDGRVGHCITLFGHKPESDRFVFHDPWPSSSLLAAENNEAGIDAQREGKRWSITAMELEQIVFAAFLSPPQWKSVEDPNFGLSYQEWTKGEFFTFFHLRQLEERVEAGLKVRVFAPAAFVGEMALLVGHRDSGRIVRTSLRVGMKWAIDNFMIALDLMKSFVSCFAPADDKEEYEKIAAELWSLRDPRKLAAIRDADPASSDAIQCIHALFGRGQSALVVTDFATLSAGRSQSPGDPPTLQLDFNLK